MTKKAKIKQEAQLPRDLRPYFTVDTWLNECQQTTPQPKQDSSHVAGFQSASQADWHRWHPGHVVACQGRQPCPWPWSRHRQPSDTFDTCRYTMSSWFSSAVRSLTTDATRSLVQAFVSCLLGCCNSYDVSERLIQKVQSVQNAATHLVFGARRCDHITYVLRQLHWLHVRRRVEYKVARFVHQSLSGEGGTCVRGEWHQPHHR